MLTVIPRLRNASRLHHSSTPSSYSILFLFVFPYGISPLDSSSFTHFFSYNRYCHLQLRIQLSGIGMGYYVVFSIPTWCYNFSGILFIVVHIISITGLCIQNGSYCIQNRYQSLNFHVTIFFIQLYSFNSSMHLFFGTLSFRVLPFRILNSCTCRLYSSLPHVITPISTYRAVYLYSTFRLS